MLLVRFQWPGGPDGGFWAHPGGGIEPGESRLEALQRELREEVGLVVTELGEEVWTKSAIFPMSGWDGQVDHIYLHRVLRFDPDPALSEEELAAEHVHELRWWPLSTLLRSDAAFSPLHSRHFFPTCSKTVHRCCPSSSRASKAHKRTPGAN